MKMILKKGIMLSNNIMKRWIVYWF